MSFSLQDIIPLNESMKIPITFSDLFFYLSLFVFETHIASVQYSPPILYFPHIHRYSILFHFPIHLSLSLSLSFSLSLSLSLSHRYTHTHTHTSQPGKGITISWTTYIAYVCTLLQQPAPHLPHTIMHTHTQTHRHTLH